MPAAAAATQHPQYPPQAGIQAVSTILIVCLFFLRAEQTKQLQSNIGLLEDVSTRERLTTVLSGTFKPEFTVDAPVQAISNPCGASLVARFFVRTKLDRAGFLKKGCPLFAANRI